MDATCKVQDNIHVFRLVHNMCPGFWVHIKKEGFFMKTIKLFQSDVYRRIADAVVLQFDKDNSKNTSCLVLDCTIFFPTGGGQSCDLGTINGFEVIDVFEKENIVYHILKGCDASIETGDTVSLEIDWDRRFDNMQRHCGEHILSGIFFRLFGGVNRGFHMGEDYMTIDISLEADENYSEINWEMAMQAELEANKVIWGNTKVSAYHFDTKAEAEKMPLRKALSLENDITIVTIGDISNPADSVACCGTHPSTAGQVGMVKIYKIEPNKGMFRIFFEAGQRALAHYDTRFDIMTKLENDLSASHTNLLSKYETQKEKARQIKDRLYHLSKEFIRREILDLKESNDRIRQYNFLDSNDIMEIGNAMSPEIDDILFLIDDITNTVFIFSSKNDCGALVKEYAPSLEGKGGGGKNFARAVFPSSDRALSFVEIINK